MAHHNSYCSKWFAISSRPLILQSKFQFYGWVLQKSKQQYLDVRNIFAGLHTEHHWRCSYFITAERKHKSLTTTAAAANPFISVSVSLFSLLCDLILSGHFSTSGLSILLLLLFCSIVFIQKLLFAFAMFYDTNCFACLLAGLLAV